MTSFRRLGVRGFTLIELLIIVVILGTVMAVGVVSWQRGQESMRLSGATRDVLATIRQARSVALVSQKPAVITFANEKNEDGEYTAKITIDAAKLFDELDDEPVYTLGGELVRREEDESPAAQGADGEAAPPGDPGQTVSDRLMPQISLELMTGIRVKVLRADEELASTSSPVNYKSSISVFSTSSAVRSQLGKTEPQPAAKSSEATADEAVDEPVEIVWGTNGRADAHTVWVYPADKQPEDGLSITVDRFGACTVSQWEDE